MKSVSILALGFVPAVAFLSACSSPTAACDNARDVMGNWRYNAIVQAPSRATLTGTMSVTQQSCSSFSGALTVTEVSATGVVRQRSGPVNGRVIDASSLRFDAFLDADARQHLASIKGDSLSGTWVIADATGSSPSGTFSSARSGAK